MDQDVPALHTRIDWLGRHVLLADRSALGVHTEIAPCIRASVPTDGFATTNRWQQADLALLEVEDRKKHKRLCLALLHGQRTALDGTRVLTRPLLL